MRYYYNRLCGERGYLIVAKNSEISAILRIQRLFEPDVSVVNVFLNFVNPLMRNGARRDDQCCTGLDRFAFHPTEVNFIKKFYGESIKKLVKFTSIGILNSDVNWSSFLERSPEKKKLKLLPMWTNVISAIRIWNVVFDALCEQN